MSTTSISPSRKSATLAARPAGLSFALTLLALLLAPTHAMAAASLQAGAGTGTPGGVLLLPVTISSDAPVRAAQFDLAYPSASLSSDGAVLDSSAPGLSITSRETTPGVRRVLIYSTTGEPFPAAAQLTIPIRIGANASPGTLPLTLSKVIFSDAAFARLASVSATDGSVVITSGTAGRFSAAVFDSAGVLQLELTAETGRSYTIESSADLRVWRLLGTQTAANGLVRVADTNTVSTPYQFYRAFGTP